METEINFTGSESEVGNSELDKNSEQPEINLLQIPTIQQLDEPIMTQLRLEQRNTGSFEVREPIAVGPSRPSTPRKVSRPMKLRGFYKEY